MIDQSQLTRFRVYRSREHRQFLCICAARNAKHALAIARQSFTLTRTAHAQPEYPVSRVLEQAAASVRISKGERP